MRRHGFDAISLVFGVIFAVTGAVFLFGNVDISQIPPAWTWPIPLMIVGALIILLAVRRDRPAEYQVEAPSPGRDEGRPRQTAELGEWPPPVEAQVEAEEPTESAETDEPKS
jgi:hypothetical protein